MVPMLLTGSDIIVRTLIEQRCDVVFGYPGGQVIDIYDSLYMYRDELHHVLTAHEQGAAHAADGYARATGRVGVVIATSGPGATNLVTGIATAHLDSVPLVAITGNVANDLIGTDGFQEIDITGITLPITKHNYFVGDVASLASTIREAFQLAASGRPGPVLVDVPKDVQQAVCEYVPASPLPLDGRPSPARGALTEAARLIDACERPFVYFGGGLISSGATEEILALADRIDAPLGCSLMGISGVPTEHPRFLGMQGMHGLHASTAAMNEADCIIAVGVRFSDRCTGTLSEFARDAKIVHIDIDAAELRKTVKSAAVLCGDAKRALQGLLELVEPRVRPAWRKEVERLKAIQAEEAFDDRGGLTPRGALLVLGEHLLPDTPVVTDVGQHQMWAAQTLAFFRPRTFLSSGGLGTMGFGLGASIGAHMATGKRTVLVTGDGSFGMCLQELATAVSDNVPLVILLLNNGVLGMVRQWQTLFFDGRHSATTLNRKTDFVALARAFGAQGVHVATLDELERAFDEAFSAEGPFLIDCAIGADEYVLPMLPPGGSMDDIIVKAGF